MNFISFHFILNTFIWFILFWYAKKTENKLFSLQPFFGLAIIIRYTLHFALLGCRKSKISLDKNENVKSTFCILCEWAWCNVFEGINPYRVAGWLDGWLALLVFPKCVLFWNARLNAIKMSLNGHGLCFLCTCRRTRFFHVNWISV